jgi:transposase
MGMDQHRAQISAEWIDTVTGEISRARIAPADRAGVRTFLTLFKDEGLEVALEATTGWRFVVEELQRAGAEVHLAESAEASALKGRKQRAKTDWADARHLRVQVGPLDVSLRAYARKQPGCRTLIDQIYGIGELTSVTILAELGDTRRFQNSRDAVRYSGLDITVHQSDARRSPGHLSRQGPSALRWALYEAAQAARRPSSPDRQYYLKTAERIGGNRACIAIARKLLERSYHLLRELGDPALEPVAT